MFAAEVTFAAKFTCTPRELPLRTGFENTNTGWQTDSDLLRQRRTPEMRNQSSTSRVKQCHHQHEGHCRIECVLERKPRLFSASFPVNDSHRFLLLSSRLKWLNRTGLIGQHKAYFNEIQVQISGTISWFRSQTRELDLFPFSGPSFSLNLVWRAYAQELMIDSNNHTWYRTHQ